MSITSPLDIAWDHAYWCEGPEFRALYPTGAAVRTGMVAVGAPSTARVGTWPDEVGTLDATQATANYKPTFYSAGISAWNGKPYVDFPDSDATGPPDNAVGLRTATFTSTNQPTEIVVIGRCTALAAGFLAWTHDAGSEKLELGSANASNWLVGDSSQFIVAGTLDTNAHVLVGKYNYPTLVEGFLDGASLGSFVPAFQHPTNQISIGPDGSSGLIFPQIVFVGVKLGALLSAGDRTDLVGFARSYYGTP